MEETKHTPGPCDNCHCSYDVHGENLVCPDFSFGEFRGWLDTRYFNAEETERMADLLAKVSQLQAFKDYVHKRLDDMGIPVDPESPHKAAGCKIGGRLDVVEQSAQQHNRQLSNTLFVLKSAESYLENFKPEWQEGEELLHAELQHIISSIEALLSPPNHPLI